MKLALIRFKRLLSALRSSSSRVPDAILGDNTITVMSDTLIDENSTVGCYTYIGRHCDITRTQIGRYCSIANNVSIGQGEHDLGGVSTSTLFSGNAYDELTRKPCEIGNDVWIGVDAIVLRGVKVGDGAVVGANSVVTRDVPPFAVAVGSPARVIRYRFSDPIIQAIRQSEWWGKNLQEASRIVTRLGGDLKLKVRDSE